MENFPVGKHHLRIDIFIICLLALTLRFSALCSLQSSLYADVLLWDERVYHHLALKLLKNASDFSPAITSIYAHLMAFVYRLFGQDTIFIRGLNILFGCCTCLLLCLIGKELSNRTAGVLTGLTASLYGPFIFYDITLLNTSLSVLLFALAVYLLIKIWQTETWLKLLLLGLISGLLFHFRSNAVLIFPVLLLTLFIRPGLAHIGFKRAVFICFFFSLGLLSANAHILLKDQNRVLAAEENASQAGLNFYIGNNLENPLPYYRPVSFSTSEPRMQGIYFKIEAERRSGRCLTAREVLFFWIGEVFRMALESPIVYMKKQTLKLFALCNRFEACDHYDIGFLSQFVGFFKWPFFSFWMVFPLGMAGIFITMQESRLRQALSAVYFTYAATLILFFTNARYRLPLLVLLIPFAVIGIERCCRLWRKKQWRHIALYGGLVALFGIIEFLPIPGTGDLTAYYNTHSYILSSIGRRSEALSYWEKSSQMNTSFAAFADLSLAANSIKEQDDSRALYYLGKIPANSFASAQKYALLGDIYSRQHQSDKAAALYEKSLSYNSGQHRILLKLINFYKKTDRKKALEKERQLYHISHLR